MEGSCEEIAQMISILNKVNEPKIQARERIVKTNKVIQDAQKEDTEAKPGVSEKQEKEWAEQKELDERMDKILNPEETQESEPTLPQRKTMTKKERREKYSRSRVIDIFKKDSHGTFVREITVESVTAVAKHVGSKHPANVSASIDSGRAYHNEWKFITRVDRGEDPVLPDEEDED